MLSTKNSEQYLENAGFKQVDFRMDQNEPVVVSGEAETITIKPDSIELLFDAEDPFCFEEDVNDSEFENLGKNCYVTTSGEIVTLNYEDVVQTPFCLESYFMDNDGFRSRSFSMPVQRPITEIDRVTCYKCDIVFCNEHKLLEHLMTHIDVNKMGCNVCEMDLNLEEKFQLHIMAVTWQSIYYCDYCRKSCAGVVRSKSQPPPPGKTYMCHDCENQMNQVAENLPSKVLFHKTVINESLEQSTQSIPFIPKTLSTTSVVFQPLLTPQSSSLSNFFQSSVYCSPPSSELLIMQTPHPTPPTEVLQDHKQKASSEVKHETSEHILVTEVQDCYKPPPKKKENKNCSRPKPKVHVVKGSIKHTLKMSTRSRSKSKSNKNCKCRYCPVAFTENYLLTAHLREKHRFHKLKYVCNICDKEFAKQRCYEDHLSLHQVNKNHICFVCNLSFLSKWDLEQHEKMHNKSEIIDTYSDDSKNVALDLRKKKKKK